MVGQVLWLWYWKQDVAFFEGVGLGAALPFWWDVAVKLTAGAALEGRAGFVAMLLGPGCGFF